MPVVLLLGGVFGALAGRSHFCTMGALSDFFLFGSGRRLRAWLLALATAMLMTAGLAGLGLVPVERSLPLQGDIAWPGLVAGGLAFGFGMVIAGGCASRNLVRLGHGSMKALIVVATMVAASLLTLLGLDIVTPPPAAPEQAAGLARPSPGGLLGPALGLDPGRIDAVLGLGLGFALLAVALADRRLRRAPEEMVAGFGIGLVVGAGWLVARFAGADDAATLMPVAFVPPWSEAGSARLAGGVVAATLGLGAVLGAFLMAAAQRRLRLERIRSREDLGRHLAGGVLMGGGGVLAMGCTIGQGVAGLATLSLASALAVAAMVAGARLGLRYLELGSLAALGRELAGLLRLTRRGRGGEATR